MTAVWAFFNVCTYNIGANSNDWVSFNKPRDGTLESAYINLQERTAARVINKADVFCLQEVFDVKVSQRPIIKTLLENGFAIFHAEGKPIDCVVALKLEAFKDCVNLSERFGDAEDDAAIVAATHRKTEERFVFVSAHARGCNLEGDVDAEDAKGGDEYCRRIAEKLSNVGSAVIVGADMNVSPEKWNKRFKEFKKFGDDFEIRRTGYTTNIKPDSPSFPNRELDYFLHRVASVSNRWFEFFRTNCSSTIRLTNEVPIHWADNPSDHLPVIAEVLTALNPSRFSKLRPDFSSNFGSSLAIIGFVFLWYVYDGYNRGA